MLSMWYHIMGFNSIKREYIIVMKKDYDFTKGDNEEQYLWQKVSSTVTPFRDNRRYNFFKEDKVSPVLDVKPKQSFRSILDLQIRTLPVRSKKNVVLADGLKHGDTYGLNKKHAKKFKTGKLNVSATLDLHGLMQSTAHEKVFAFINMSYEKGFRKVIIITGKGKGVLQSAVPEWLNHETLRSKILSFDYAQGHHGGSGALYVLLKRWDK